MFIKRKKYKKILKRMRTLEESSRLHGETLKFHYDMIGAHAERIYTNETSKNSKGSYSGLFLLLGFWTGIAVALVYLASL